MKIFCVFLILVILGIPNISCTSGRKEIHSEQNKTPGIAPLPAIEKKSEVKDSIPSPASLALASVLSDTVTGLVSVAGNEPFTELLLTDSSGVQYYVEADSSLKSYLWQMQGKRIGVIGLKKSSPLEKRIHVSSFHTIP